MYLQVRCKAAHSKVDKFLSYASVYNDAVDTGCTCFWGHDLNFSET